MARGPEVGERRGWVRTLVGEGVIIPHFAGSDCSKGGGGPVKHLFLQLCAGTEAQPCRLGATASVIQAGQAPHGRDVTPW